MGSGGGGTQYVTSTQQTSNLPEYAQPYFTSLLNQAQGLTLGGTYTPYGGQRIADYNQNQTGVQNQIMGMQTPGQFGDASFLATNAGLNALNGASYHAPYGFSAQQINTPQLSNFSMSAPQQVQGQQNTAPTYNAARTGYNPNITAHQMSGPGQVSSSNVSAQQLNPYAFANMVNSPTINAAQTNYGTGNLQKYQMAMPDQFGEAQADQYMSPYISKVLEIQKSNAVRDAQKTQLATNLGAARQGTYGGARQLLATTERERNLGDNLANIDATGLQSAYTNAQQQFNADRGAKQTAQQANLQSLLQTQGLEANSGLQTALANLNAEQQARITNAANSLQAQGMNAQQALQAALANQSTGLQASLANQQSGLQASLANQNMGYQTGLANLQSQQQAQQLGVNTGLQTSLANLSSEQQALVQNQAAQLQTQGLNAQQALQAALANQQYGFQTGQQNLQSALQTQQLGGQLGLDALKANQSASLQAQQLQEQSRQFGSNLGLQGLAQANQSAQTLANLGTAQQQADLSRLGAQQQVGGQQQQLEQQYLDQQYADFLRQRDYPIEMLQYYNAVLRGLPITPNTTTTTYAPPPSMASQVLGTGLGALGLANSLKT